METYTEQKKRHQDEISGFDGLFFAFSNDQLKEGLDKVKAETKDIVSIGAGGFILKTQIKAFTDCLKRHDQERKDLKKNIKIFFDALVYELRNHEYCITYSTQDALDALGLTRADVEPTMLKKACKEALEGCYA